VPSLRGELVRRARRGQGGGGREAGERASAQLVVDKYWDGLPLHRQKERFGRLGFPVAVSTLADQVTWATDCSGRSGVRHFALLASRVMHLDGTSLSVLDRDSPAGIKLGSLWATSASRARCRWRCTSTPPGKKTAQRPGELGPETCCRCARATPVADRLQPLRQELQAAGAA